MFAPQDMMLISCRLNAACLKHQHDGLLGRTGPVHDPFGDGDALARIQFYRLVFEIDEQLPFRNKEELVIIVVLMPMEFAFHDPDSHDAFIHLCQGLIEPFIGTGRHHLGNVDALEVAEFCIQPGHVVEFVFHFEFYGTLCKN